jgi:protein required for attachment to host cells
MPNQTWIVISNTNTCKIYQYNKVPYNLSLIKEIHHDENRLKDIDITTDKSGHYQNSSSGQGSFVPQSDPKEVQIDTFSKEIADELDKARNVNAYGHLIIIAAPRMYGFLNQHLNKHVKALVKQDIQKDIISFSDNELEHFLKKEM